MELKGYCPEHHTLEKMYINFCRNFKGFLTVYIIGYCPDCKQNYIFCDGVVQIMP